MNDWFEWNGVKCTDYGIYVTEQPPPTIPEERVTFTDVPGRSGSLTTLEGDYVYNDMVLTATCVISDPDRIPEIAGWLRGSGTVSGFISKIRVSIFSLLSITAGIGHVVNRDVVSFTAVSIELVIVSSM